MARLIGGSGTSHSPRLAHAYDDGLQNDPAWAPIFAGYAPAKYWLKRASPDLVVVIYNDHVNQFFFDVVRPSRSVSASGTHRPTRGGASVICPISRVIPISAVISPVR